MEDTPTDTSMDDVCEEEFHNTEAEEGTASEDDRGELMKTMRMKGPERVAIIPAALSPGEAAPTLCVNILTGTTNHGTGPNGMRQKTKPPLVSSPPAQIVQVRVGVRGILTLCCPPCKMIKTLLADRQPPGKPQPPSVTLCQRMTLWYM